MENYLNRNTFRAVELDITDSDTITDAVDINGWAVVAICTPDALTNLDSEITFSVDPGDGTFRSVVADNGTALTLTNVGVDEYIQVQEGNPPIVGAQLKLTLSAAEGADRTFFVILSAIGSG